ncbi:MAG: Flagellar hook-length control protein, partial [Campylobacterota bacterium]|nr:Flagellar hook-length control protein [Campylobacterota bacterium]
LKTKMPKTEIPREVVSEKKELKSEMPKTETPREVVSEKKELKSEMPKTETPREVVSEKKELKTEMPKEATPRSEIVSKEIPKELRELSIFKTQAVVQHTTTEQILQAKANNITQKIEQKVPKERADETLMLLLRGEKPSGENALFTADFSVATAKIIAPSVTQEGIKTLEQLLNADSLSSEQNGSSVKTEPLTTHKADSFEVKLNEAKQMIKYLSNDVKNAIDDYRSPFTRVKVQLNPQNLGEVDLTVVQRGKNLHVNISSNNAAINTLSMNINELRVQLNNSGINSATFNFSSGSQSGDTNAGGQHQQRQNERQAHEEYGYFEAEEAAEEILSSLEIIVPRYI